MSLSQSLVRAADMTNAILDGLRLIESVTGKSLGRRAEDILRIVRSIVSSLVSGLADPKVDAEAMIGELDRLKAEIKANDALADSELDKKFPPPGAGG